MDGWVGLTVIIELVSVQIGFNWNWPTGNELGNFQFGEELPSILLFYRQRVTNMYQSIFGAILPNVLV